MKSQKPLTAMAFAVPHDGWKNIAKGKRPEPQPLEDHGKLWAAIADRIGHKTPRGVTQLAPVIGGRRRYHHRPLTSWLLSNGKVLTLTSDPMEATVWNKVKGKRHPALPLIYDTFSVTFSQPDVPKAKRKPAYWAILHERLTWPLDADWLLWMDTFFRWRAMAGNALRPAKQSDLEGFLRFIIDPEKSDPKTVQRRRIEHALPWQMAKERRKDVADRRKNIWAGQDFEGKVKWAKAALAFLATSKIHFRDFDPSNLAKTMKGGRTVITNLAESRSRPVKPGRVGSITGQMLTLAATTLATAYQKNPKAVLRAIMRSPGVVSADASSDPAAAPASLLKALEIMQRVSRHIDRDSQCWTEEASAVRPEVAATILQLAMNLERSCKRVAQKMVSLR